MAIPTSLHFEVKNTLGMLVIGNIIVAICYGITVIQAYTFYRRRHNDPHSLKYLVLVLWILDTLHIAFISHAVYTYAINGVANPLVLLSPTWSMMAQVVVAGVSDAIVRGYFCRIVVRLSNRNWCLGGAITITSLLAFGTSLAFAAKGFRIGNWFAFAGTSWIIYVNLGASIVSDITIATSLCVLLKKHHSGFAQTDSMLRVLMLYTINTCALTGVATAVCLVVYAATPALNFAHAAIYFALPTLLLNSLLASLNARKALRRSLSGISTIPSLKPRPPAEIQSRDELSRTCSNANTLNMFPASYLDSPRTSPHELKLASPLGDSSTMV